MSQDLPLVLNSEKAIRQMLNNFDSIAEVLKRLYKYGSVSHLKEEVCEGVEGVELEGTRVYSFIYPKGGYQVILPVDTYIFGAGNIYKLPFFRCVALHKS